MSPGLVPMEEVLGSIERARHDEEVLSWTCGDKCWIRTKNWFWIGERLRPGERPGAALGDTHRTVGEHVLYKGNRLILDEEIGWWYRVIDRVPR